MGELYSYVAIPDLLILPDWYYACWFSSTHKYFAHACYHIAFPIAVLLRLLAQSTWQRKMVVYTSSAFFGCLNSAEVYVACLSSGTASLLIWLLCVSQSQACSFELSGSKFLHCHLGIIVHSSKFWTPSPPLLNEWLWLLNVIQCESAKAGHTLITELIINGASSLTDELGVCVIQRECNNSSNVARYYDEWHHRAQIV